MEYRICNVEDLPEGERVIAEVGGIEIGVFNIKGRYVAYENRCMHQGGPVCRGRLLGRWEELLSPDKRVTDGRHSDTDIDIVCPWHGWEYDALTGENIADRTIRLRKIELFVDDGALVALVPDEAGVRVDG